MLIGLVSDTHIRVPGYRAGLSMLSTNMLPDQVKEALRGVDLILHAGDIYTLPILDDLESIAPVMAAEGDDDPFEVVNDRRVRSRQRIKLNGVTIWMAHQSEMWQWDDHEKLPDVIVSGHTHKAMIEKQDGILRVNPGSPTFPSYKYEAGTVGLLTIDGNKVEAQIIQLTGKLNGSVIAGLKR